MAQCFATFSGVQAVKSAVVPRSLGIVPNSMVLECVPQISPLPTIGVLSLGHGVESISIPDAKVDWVSFRMSTSGHVMVVKLLDRRWRWRFLYVSGRYNVRLQDGTIVPYTQRTPQELAAILFIAMGEMSFDVSQLPNTGYPEINWDKQTAATALHELCQISGCDISLNLNNSTSIVRLGVGASLPVNADLMTPSVTADPPEGPDVVTVLCGETLYESRLKLRPVGLDIDGEVKFLDELEYYDGVANTADIKDFNDINKNNLPDLSDEEIELARQCAKLSVYRWYLAVSQANGSQVVPGYGTINDISQILPLSTHLLTAQDSPTLGSSGTKASKRSRVFGTFCITDNVEEFKNTTSDLSEHEFRHSLDRHTGLVKFNEPVVKTGSDRTNFSAADLYLQTCYGVRDSATGGKVRFTAQRNITGASSGILLEDVSRMVELGAMYVAQYDNNLHSVTSITDNITSLNDEVQSILDVMQARWLSSVFGFGLYRSIKAVSTDGTIRQIVWRASDTNGTQTSVSYNSEAMAGPVRQSERNRRRLLDFYGNQQPIDRRRLDQGDAGGFFRLEGF